MSETDWTKGMLSRRDVAERLGISTSSVRRLEFDRLTPVQDEAGVWRFDPSEVDALDPKTLRRRAMPTAHAPTTDEDRAAARRGRLAARVFKMFARSMTLPQIVVLTKQEPDVIRGLYREWQTSLDEGDWARRD